MKSATVNGIVYGQYIYTIYASIKPEVKSHKK